MSTSLVVASGTVLCVGDPHDLVIRCNGKIFPQWGYQVVAEIADADATMVNVSIHTFKEWLAHKRPLRAFLVDTFGQEDSYVIKETETDHVHVNGV